jgi:hypothetical protein
LFSILQKYSCNVYGYEIQSTPYASGEGHLEGEVIGLILGIVLRRRLRLR